ncbi:MAG: hypothetical protein ACRDF5_11520, partial [bacterium]
VTVRFVERALPDLPVPAEVPTLPPSVFEARAARLEEARQRAGLDCLAIYADREHSANLAWRCGFDPRFEETLWIEAAAPRPTLLVGNENLGYAPAQLRVPAEVVLYQPFSLPNQDRSRSADLEGLLRRAGVRASMRIGLVGWKPQERSEVPYWIVRAFADLTGREPANATTLLMDPDQGLRTVLEPEMIRFCEYASSLTSTALRDWVFSLREGLSEREAAAALRSYGLELSCHPMVNFGRPIPSGLKSPRNSRVVRGEYAQAAFGLIGALTCRAGRLIGREDADRVDDEDGYSDLVENYLQVVRAWFASVRIGATGGEVVAAADGARSAAWDPAVNQGHLIHLDEWVSSPFYAGSRATLKSGYAIQQDIIPVPRQGAAVLNMEDGIVLADGDLQERLRALDPEMMARVRARRELMESLGYEIAPEVLPLSNIAGGFFPFLLTARYVAIVG